MLLLLCVHLCLIHLCILSLTVCLFLVEWSLYDAVLPHFCFWLYVFVLGGFIMESECMAVWFRCRFSYVEGNVWWDFRGLIDVAGHLHFCLLVGFILSMNVVMEEIAFWWLFWEFCRIIVFLEKILLSLPRVLWWGWFWSILWLLSWFVFVLMSVCEAVLLLRIFHYLVDGAKWLLCNSYVMLRLMWTGVSGIYILVLICFLLCFRLPVQILFSFLWLDLCEFWIWDLYRASLRGIWLLWMSEWWCCLVILRLLCLWIWILWSE